MKSHNRFFASHFERPKLIFRTWFLFSALVLDSACFAQSSFQFVDRREESGIVSKHYVDETEPWLPRLMVAGVATFDYDGDGALDLFLPSQPLPFPTDSQAVIQPADYRGNRLYRNLGDARFVDVTHVSKLTSQSHTLGVVAGDLDHDGDQDLVLNNWGGVELFLNQGEGTFEKATLTQTPQNPLPSKNALLFGAGICLIDVENDGDLDIFAANYVRFTTEAYRLLAPRSGPYPPGPKDFDPMPNTLWLNDGEGRFVDRSAELGISHIAGPSMGIIAGDWDDDGYSEVFLCSDAAPNQLLVNASGKVFTDDAILHGVAFDVTGSANGSMGVDAGDIDNDGLEDLLISNYTGQTPVHYRNLGGGLFEDVSRRSRVGSTLLAQTNWGVGLVDFDHDGDLDAFFANGHFLREIEKTDDRTRFRETNTIMRNDGHGRFEDLSRKAGPGLQIKESSRGAAFDDLDSDGDIDILILNASSYPTLLINESTLTGGWLKVRLIGKQSNRDGIGAQVIVEGRQRIVRFARAGRGYQSHFGTTLHFGLPNTKEVPKVKVRWPSGKTESYPIDYINFQLTCIEGNGTADR